MMNILRNPNSCSITLNEINKLVEKDTSSFIEQSEKKYDNIINNVAKTILQQDIKIIMLSGPSAGGKTTTAKKIDSVLKKHGSGALIISLDDFYQEKDQYPIDKNGKPNYESIFALDLPKLQSCISDLLKNNTFTLNKFDFKTKKKSIKETTFLLPKGYVAIFEGLHTLNPIITEKITSNNYLRIYVSIGENISVSNSFTLSGTDLRFMRRLVRDTNFRHVDAEFTFNIWDSVCLGEEEYIRPYKETANIIIKSIHYYEPCVIGKMCVPILKTINKTSKFYDLSLEFISEINKFNSIDKSLVPDSSLLKEFIGGGIYRY